jgi:uncharacterized protein YggT (Ycf19 family)
MQFNSWDTLFNILLLIFWFRIWERDDRSTTINPYIASLHRLSDAVVNFLRPVFFVLSPRMIAAVSLVFLIALRAFAAPREEGAWELILGFSNVVRQPTGDSVNSFLLFSLLSFALFLFKLWGLSLIFVRADSGAQSENTTAALFQLARPFSDLRYEWRPGVLFVFGCLLVAAMDLVGGIEGGSAPYQPLRCAVLALACWVSILSVVIQIIFLLIIGSWVSLFTSAQNIMFFCKDWMDFFLGPMKNYPLRIGMLDLTPLAFMFLLFIVEGLLMGILFNSYGRLL